MIKMLCRYFLLSVITIFSFVNYLSAQDYQFTEHWNEVQKQRAMNNYPIALWDSLRCKWYGECAVTGLTSQPASITTCSLAKRMFGWHSIGSSSASYQWLQLSDLSYFSYDVDPATGNAKNPTSMAGFSTDATVLAALANGVKVNLCATLFNNTTEFSVFFSNSAAQTNLINSLVNHVVAANAKGINIDFEGSGLSSTYISQFVSFMSNLSIQLHATVPNSELSIDLQGGYANSSTLLSQLLSSTDLFILMGYDYYWSGQFYPGPVAPTYQFPSVTGDPNGHGNVSNDLNNLIKNVGASKSILAMPYYGRRWRTTNGCVIPATGNAASISTQTYAQFRQNSNGYYSSTLRETNSFNAYHCFNDVSSIPNEQFIDDSFSLQKKYNIIRQRGIAGAAVWRLGYDAGYMDCWNLVDRNLSICPITPLTDTLYDMGGPTGNYHNNENYTFSIAPPNATAVTLSFLNFDFEAGYDSLKIYNGPSIASPLIGNFSGNLLPPPVIATNGIITIQFHSDGATTKTGYRAVYMTHICSTLRKTIASGNFNDPASWECGLVPGTTDSIEIQTGNTINFPVSAQVRYLRIKPGGSVNINDAAINITVGTNSSKISQFVCEGSLNLINGSLLVFGKVVLGSNCYFNLSGGKLIIDGNSGSDLTSVADGENLFTAPVTAGSFNFSGGILQFANPPLGANSQAIVSAYNFSPASTLVLGDGVSTIPSNNINGFGGNGMPDEIGNLILDAATVNSNRIFNVIRPLKVKTTCEVRSGNLVQTAAMVVGN
jgi:spore germination protein YaaH